MRILPLVLCVRIPGWTPGNQIIYKCGVLDIVCMIVMMKKLYIFFSTKCEFYLK